MHYYDFCIHYLDLEISTLNQKICGIVCADSYSDAVAYIQATYPNIGNITISEWAELGPIIELSEKALDVVLNDDPFTHINFPEDKY
jgi:hypothetical protein